MARIRMIKPEFFDDPDLAALSFPARLFFIGLWTQADREGRLLDDPRRLKARLFPYDDVDTDALAVELHGKDMIRRYQGDDGRAYIWIRSFVKHQRPHPKEPESVIPECRDQAVERHGEPWKNPSSQQTNGTRNLDSGTRKRENGSADRAPQTMAPIIGRNPHLTHSACDPELSYCVPQAVHHKLADRLAPRHGGDRDAAKDALQAWYPTVWAKLEPKFIMGDAFKFWQAQFDAAFANPLPEVVPAVAPMGKLTTRLATALANIKREEEEQERDVKRIR